MSRTVRVVDGVITHHVHKACPDYTSDGRYIGPLCRPTRDSFDSARYYLVPVYARHVEQILDGIDIVCTYESFLPTAPGLIATYLDMLKDDLAHLRKIFELIRPDVTTYDSFLHHLIYISLTSAQPGQCGDNIHQSDRYGRVCPTCTYRGHFRIEILDLIERIIHYLENKLVIHPCGCIEGNVRETVETFLEELDSMQTPNMK